MSKLNPLFVDSTKSTGESVGTRIELSGTTLRPGDQLFARVRDSFGRDQKVSLTPEENIFVGRIWLTHQQEITYQFIIERGGDHFANSQERRIQASHVIIDQWQFGHDESSVETVATLIASPTESLPETFSEVFPESESFSHLIDKWGL